MEGGGRNDQGGRIKKQPITPRAQGVKFLVDSYGGYVICNYNADNDIRVALLDEYYKCITYSA